MYVCLAMNSVLEPRVLAVHLLDTAIVFTIARLLRGTILFFVLLWLWIVRSQFYEDEKQHFLANNS